MLINNKKLDSLGCELIDFKSSSANLTNIGSHWGNDMLIGIKGKKNHTYRPLKISFLFEGDTPIIEMNICKFIEEIKNSIIKYDSYNYDVEITQGNINPEIITDSAYILKLTLDILNVFEDEKSKIITSNSSIFINSPKPCYANLELNASASVISYTVSINNIEITVRNIKDGETVYIGSGKVTAGEKSKINDVEILEFPILIPGTNNIKVNRSDVNLTIKYCERW